MDAIIRRTPEISWQESPFPGTAEVKILRHEAGAGARTVLVRVPAGGQITPHTHLAAVQHHVLDGDYETQGETHGPETYRSLPKDANVGALGTKGGVTILMVYDPI
jgi:quercetin dioxygenase-like cupin family protein